MLGGPDTGKFVAKVEVSESVGIINHENMQSYPTEYENGKLEPVQY